MQSAFLLQLLSHVEQGRFPEGQLMPVSVPSEGQSEAFTHSQTNVRSDKKESQQCERSELNKLIL